MNDNFDSVVISNVLDEDAEFIPLLSPDDEEQINAGHQCLAMKTTNEHRIRRDRHQHRNKRCPK